jgi:hypothetical protein
MIPSVVLAQLRSLKKKKLNLLCASIQRFFSDVLKVEKEDLLLN